MTLRQSWLDKRLAYDSNGRLDVSCLRMNSFITIYLISNKPFVLSHSKHFKLFLKKVKWITLKHEEYEKKIWIPDTFMRNDVKGKRLETIQPDNYIRIFPDGKVLYSVRYPEFR